MNKFATYTILALASLAVVANCAELADEDMSEAVLNTSDDQETAKLEKANLRVFSDFCVSSRDYVLADIKRQSGELSSKVFSLFFRSAEDMAREAMKVQNYANNVLSDQLANRKSEVEQIENGISEVEQIEDGVAKVVIANGQQQIRGQSQPVALFTAFKTALGAMSAQVGQLFSERLEGLKSLGTAENVARALRHGCEQAKIYEEELMNQLEEYKSESLTPEAQEQFKFLGLGQIPCTTSSRIIRIEGLCTFVKISERPLLKMWATIN